jgi:hypothetical protein
MRLRRKHKRGEKIKVLFIDTEVAKWKAQSLYLLMKERPDFEPIIGISRRDADVQFDSETIERGMVAAKSFFDRLGDRNVYIYDSARKAPINLDFLSPDIIFFQQPWYREGCHSIEVLHRKAITCYIPYGIPSYGLDISARLWFHRLIAYHFVLNKAWVREFKRGVSPFYYSGKLLGLGHTMFDQVHGPQDSVMGDTKQKVVIYAPHFSISKSSDKMDFLLKLSTFLENGSEILMYAKEHSEIKWVFKPHPVLRTALIAAAGWTEEEVDSYYSEWEKIGKVNTSGDYGRLFDSAYAMITDCASFLTEFGATGKPLIRLISSRNTSLPGMPARKLFSSFYEVHNLKEMYDCFKMVLEEEKDPNKRERLAIVRESNLTGQNAAKNIMDFFDKEFKIKK